MDADGLTMACATSAEARAARRAGLRTAVVGLAARQGVPEGSLVSFGLAGGLGDAPTGTVIDATRVVDEQGRTLWSGGPLGVPEAVDGTLLASERVIDDPAERRRLLQRTGAVAADLESGVLATTGRLVGCLRVVSDTPRRTLHGLCMAVHDDGTYAWSSIARGLARSPVGFTRAGMDGARALASLERAGRRWAA